MAQYIMFIPRTNLELYKSFIAVYHFECMTYAAKYLNTDRTAISKHIKELEKVLGIILFTRHSQGVTITADGEKLYKEISPMFERMQYIESNMKELNGKSMGEIRIVATTNFAGHILTECVRSFNERYPHIKFINSHQKIGEAIKELKELKIDLIFNTIPFDDDIEFERSELLDFSETYFASQEYAKQNDLQSIITKEKFDTLSVITLAPQETKKNTKHCVDTQEMLFKYVNKDFGVGQCIEQFLDLNYPENCVFKFKVEGMEISKKIFECIYSRNSSQIATKFLESVRTYLCK